MPESPPRSKNQSHLRVDAEDRLRQGLAPLTDGWVLSAEVLMSLYKLASDPHRAADGLKLLHELQVHQVELDLQLKQLESAEFEISAELTHYQGLFEFAPVGYLVLSHDGRIVQSNVMGTKLLSVERDELGDRFADSLLTPESRPALTDLLKSLREGGSGGSCTVQPAINPDTRRLQLTATMMPGGDTILVAITGLD